MNPFPRLDGIAGNHLGRMIGVFGGQLFAAGRLAGRGATAKRCPPLGAERIISRAAAQNNNINSPDSDIEWKKIKRKRSFPFNIER